MSELLLATEGGQVVAFRPGREPGEDEHECVFHSSDDEAMINLVVITESGTLLIVTPTGIVSVDGSTCTAAALTLSSTSGCTIVVVVGTGGAKKVSQKLDGLVFVRFLLLRQRRKNLLDDSA